MMMAHDSSPGPSGLDEQTIETVRAVLVKYISNPTNVSSPLTLSRDTPVKTELFGVPSPSAADRHGDELRTALHTMAAEARAKAVLPESLLIVLKDIWHSLPQVNTIREQPEQVRLLQRVVTMCIKEYYAD